MIVGRIEVGGRRSPVVIIPSTEFGARWFESACAEDPVLGATVVESPDLFERESEHLDVVTTPGTSAFDWNRGTVIAFVILLGSDTKSQAATISTALPSAVPSNSYRTAQPRQKPCHLRQCCRFPAPFGPRMASTVPLDTVKWTGRTILT